MQLSQTMPDLLIHEERRKQWIALMIATLGSMIVSAMVVMTNGNYFVGLSMLGVLAMGLLIRFPVLGIYLVAFAAMLLEQFYIVGLPNPVTLEIPFWLNLNLVTGIGALVVNPLEVVFGLVILGWYVRRVAGREYFLLPCVPNLGVTLLFAGMLLFFAGLGLATGGDFKIALWEVRALFYLVIAYLMGVQLLRRADQAELVVKIVVVALSIKGLQGCWRYFVTLGGDIGDVPAITGHEDALFIVTWFALLAGLVVMNGGSPRLRAFMLVSAAPLFITFIYAQRRVCYGALVFSMIILLIMLDRQKQKLFLMAAIPLAIVGALYLAAFWNKSGGIAMPAQQVKSIFVEGEEADSSNTYREVEDYNLQETIRAYPQGLGFGKRYLIIIPLAEVDFPLWDYIPHNAMNWMWAKTGFFGFATLWLFVGAFAVRILQVHRKLTNPFHRSITVMVMCMLINQMIVSKYDLQLTYYRNMVYLGLLLALLVPLENAAEAGSGNEEE